MKWIEIKYEVAIKDNGQILLKKDGCTVGVRDSIENIALNSLISTDYKYEEIKLNSKI